MVDHHHQDSNSSSSSSSNPNPKLNSTTLPDHSSPGWAIQLLTECACSIATNDTARAHHLTWTLNELASPYGDTQQKLAAYFLRALVARLTSSGPATFRSLVSAYELTVSFDSTVKTALKYQEVSPWSAFGHVASNSAILESFLSSSCRHLHILDLSNTFCTQWPNLLEALATHSTELDSPPHLITITTVLLFSSSSSSSISSIMDMIHFRMEKFARIMDIPLKFKIIHYSGDLSTLDLHQFIQTDDNNDIQLVVNMINALRQVRQRDNFLKSIQEHQPKIIIVVEEEANLEEESFLDRFNESLRFFSAYFYSLDESFKSLISNERLALERVAGRAVLDLVACQAEESTERRETRRRWTERMRLAGMKPVELTNDVEGDVKALVRRYGDDRKWLVGPAGAEAAGLVLKWEEEPVVWASVWKV